jgi:hypothetical protein
MRKNTIFLIVLFFMGYGNANCQKEPDIRIKGTYAGQINLATNFSNSTFLNFGGPGIKVKLSKINFGVYMLPSLRYFYDKPRPNITPILGTGIYLECLKNKKLVLSVPMYYYASKNKWIAAFSLGYAF